MKANDPKSLFERLISQVRFNSNSPGANKPGSVQPLKIELNAHQLEKTISYLKLLEEWSPRVDLVAPATQPLLIENHIVDCLAASQLMANMVGAGEGYELLDVGSGAGLPGVLTAILCPEFAVTALEPREKRVVFLKEVVRRLSLDNFRVVQGRLGEATSGLGNQFDLITSRAFEDESLLTSRVPLMLEDGGIFARMVGPSWDPEEASRKAYAVSSDKSEQNIELLLAEVIDYILPNQGSRRLAVYEMCFT